MTLDALVPLLRCPDCGAPLALDRVRQRDAEAGDCGLLRCGCAAYPVLDGVPILRSGRLDRHSIADDLVLAPGPEVEAIIARVRDGRALDALVEVLSPPVCPWPLNRVGALRRLSLRGPLRSTGMAARRRRVRRMLARRATLTAEDWLSLFYWHAPEVYDPFSYFFFRFGTPRHLATLGLLAALPPRDQASGPVLDLACGYGHLSHTLTAQGHAVVGIDQNVHQAWLARHYVAPGAAFVCADAGQPLPVCDGSLGSAFCSDAFHYVRDKAACLAELDRATAGGPVLLATVGNVLVGEPDGHELTPDGYADLFEGWHWTVRTEAGLLARYRDGLGPDLSAPSDDLERTKWLSYAATRHGADDLLREHGPLGEWPHAAGVLSVNPLYERDGDRRVLRFPSRWYQAENGNARDYLPPTLALDAQATPEAVSAAAFVGLPKRYARDAGRPATLAASRALDGLIARVRSLLPLST